MTANVIAFTSSFDCFGVDFGGADILITGGTIRLVECNGLGNIHIEDGTLRITASSCGTITLDSGNGESLYGSRLSCNGLDLTGGGLAQFVVIDGLSMAGGQLIASGTFDQFTISGVIGQTDSTGGAFPLVSLTSMEAYRLDLTILRSAQHGILLTDCVAGDHFLTIIDPGAGTDNTYDGVNLAGVCDRLSFYGSVRGAVIATNNPQYGFNAAAGTLVCDVWMGFTGYQTGATNDASGNVVFHT